MTITLTPNEIITGPLPKPDPHVLPSRRFRCVRGPDGHYRLAESLEGTRLFAAVRAAGITTIQVEVVRDKAYNAGVFTEPVTCTCRPAQLRAVVTPGGLPHVMKCECAPR